MTRITTVTDFVISELATLFPSRTKMRNSFTISNNSLPFLRNSYGMRRGAEASGRPTNKDIVTVYDFIFIISKEVLRTDHDSSAFDTVGKAIDEDILTIRKHFYDNDNLSTTPVDKVDLGGSTPMSEVIVSKNNILFKETTIRFSIRENFV